MASFNTIIKGRNNITKKSTVFDIVVTSCWQPMH